MLKHAPIKRSPRERDRQLGEQLTAQVRAVLDAASVEEAHETVRSATFGSCIHLLIANDGGNSRSLELHADDSREPPTRVAVIDGEFVTS